MPRPLCFTEAVENAARHNRIAIFCYERAARAANHTHRSYWLSNHTLHVQWREQALADAIGWASR